MSSLNELFTDIADAIRSRNGTEDKILATDFPEEILSLDTVNGEEITVTPSTVKQVYTPSTGYNAITRVDVDAVTNSIDNNIAPENIKKDVTILGITGTLEEGAGGSVEGAKLFNSVEEMNASTENEEGDLAVVYSSVIANLAKGIPFSSVSFPATVTLPEAVTTSTYTYLRATDPDVWAEAQISLGSQYFDFNYYGNTGQIMVYYESTDGMTYTKMDGPDTIELGAELVDNSSRWNDNFGYFMQVTTANFEGLFVYEADVWGYAPNQINISAPNQLIPGVKAYGSKGIVEGDGSIYVDSVDVLTKKYSYDSFSSHDYINRIKTDATREDGVIKKYNYDESGIDILNVEKKLAYTLTGDRDTFTIKKETGFITNGIIRDYTFDDDYLYACHSSDVNTMIKFSRKNMTAQTMTCTGTVASTYGTSTDYPTYRWLYNGDIYMLHCTAASYTSADNSITVTIRKYDLTNKTMSDIYSKKVNVGTYYSNALNAKELSATYANGKAVINVMRVYRTSSSGSTVYYKSYTYTYDLATGVEKTIQNGTSIHSGSYSTEGYYVDNLVNTDGKYIYITYSLYNFYQYKFDLETGAQIYGGSSTKPSNYGKKRHFPFVYFNDRYALMPSGSYTNSTYHSELTRMDLATGATDVLYEAPAFSTGYYEEWATDIHCKKIVLRNMRVCDIVDDEPVFGTITDVISQLDYTFVECIEKPNLKIYKNLYNCIYVSRITDVTEEEGFCDIYGVWGSYNDLVTPQTLITDFTESLILNTDYTGTISPEEYNTAVDTATEILGEEVNE